MCGPLEKFLMLRHAAACFYLHKWVPTHLWEIELTNNNNRVYVKTTANFVQAITDCDIVHLFRKFKIQMKRQKTGTPRVNFLRHQQHTYGHFAGDGLHSGSAGSGRGTLTIIVGFGCGGASTQMGGGCSAALHACAPG